MDESISLNKFISDTGYCSRREADNLITSGRVLLNDKVAQLGNRYNPGDTVEVDGSLITAAKKEKRVYLALNKPAGITTTTELTVKDNIISFVNYPKRIFPIGRLDKDSEGLIFLTNDGDIINKILRAGNNHEKEYIVRVNKPIDNNFVQQMSQGVPVLETTTLPCKVQVTGRQTFRITLTQGLNRQIRRMCEYLGYAVTGLQRVRIMNIRLDQLPLGKWRYLSEAEMAQLNESVADSAKTVTGPKKRRPFFKDGRPVKPFPGAGEREKPAFAVKEKAGAEKEKPKGYWKDRPRDKDKKSAPGAKGKPAKEKSFAPKGKVAPAKVKPAAVKGKPAATKGKPAPATGKKAAASKPAKKTGRR